MPDGYDVNFDNRLERELEKRAFLSSEPSGFPPVGINRFDLYKRIKSSLNDKYYRDVGSGLTADTHGGAFTRHDLGHVDDVIRRAGELLGDGSEAETPAISQLKSFEIFVLLVACLIHDVGNLIGRSEHEQRARKALSEVAPELSPKECSLIARIARAHGGKARNGSKDTIGELPIEDGVESSKVYPQRLAAVLRYADELAENSRRANSRHHELSDYPNRFCQCISVRIDYDSRRVSLDFTVSDEDCVLYSSDETETKMYFVDYIIKRVKKAELERRYCDRFTRGFATFLETRVNIEFLKEHVDFHNEHFELRESGYPQLDDDLTLGDNKFSGEEIAKMYREAEQAE